MVAIYVAIFFSINAIIRAIIDRPDEISLKKLEFIWLIFGAIAIFSYVEKSKHLVAEHNLPLEEELVQFRLKRLRAEARDAEKYICSDAPYDVEYFVKGTRNKETRPQACEWYQNFDSHLSAIGTALDASRWLKSLQPPDLAAKQWPYNDLFPLVEGIKKSGFEIERLRADLKPGLLEMTLTYIFPYIFGLAIGVRFYKATGELLNALSKLTRADGKS